MARHKELASNAYMVVYFFDPHSFWQLGTNVATQHSLADFKHPCFTSLWTIP